MSGNITSGTKYHTSLLLEAHAKDFDLKILHFGSGHGCGNECYLQGHIQRTKEEPSAGPYN